MSGFTLGNKGAGASSGTASNQTSNLDADGKDKVIPAVDADPTAEEVGLDVEREQAEDVIGAEMAANQAANYGVTHDNVDDVVVFSSHPMQNHQIGPYQFENSLLRLPSDKVGDFEKVLDQLPASERINIRKLDMNRVQNIIESRQAVNGVTDSAAGRAALANLHKVSPLVGTDAVEDMNKPTVGFTSNDGNDPVVIDADPERMDAKSGDNVGAAGDSSDS